MIASLITQIAAAPKTHSARFARTKIEFQLPGKCRHKLKLNSRDVISAYNFARRKTVKITRKNKKKISNEPCSKRNGGEIDRNPQNVHNFSISNISFGEAGGGPNGGALDSYSGSGTTGGGGTFIRQR